MKVAVRKALDRLSKISNCKIYEIIMRLSPASIPDYHQWTQFERKVSYSPRRAAKDSGLTD